MSKIPSSVEKQEIPMPENIRSVIPVGGIKLSVKEAVATRHIGLAAVIMAKYILSKGEFAELNADFSEIPSIEEYDIAVNFHIHSPFLVRYVAEKVIAKKKYTWIHNDFSTTRYDIKKLQQYLTCIDHFFCVAENLKFEFTNIFPEYKDKTSVALNIVPVEKIKEKSQEFYPDEFKNIDCTKLLTVGRVEEQKGYDIAVDVAKKLSEKGARFQWFVLGDGSLRQGFEKELKHSGLSDKMHFLGIRMNPYPYFRNCDIYIQTSRHEGYVTTVTEAKIFNKPIACTDVSGAREQIVDGVTGRIVECDVDEIYRTVAELISNKDICRSYSERICASSQREAEYSWLKYFE